MAAMTAAAIAQLVGGELRGEAGITVEGVAGLEEAGATQVSFLGNDKYKPLVLSSKAGVVLVPKTFAAPAPAGRAWVLCANTSTALSTMVQHFLPPPPVPPPGVHEKAVVDPTAQLGARVHVGPFAVIEAGAVIGDDCIIQAQCYVGQGAVLGARCRLWPQVVVRERCCLGNDVLIHCGTVIGSDGFGYEPGRARHTKIPQLGIVQIDDDVEIGANVTIDRARFGRTWVKRGTKIDNLVQLGHNVVVGEMCFVVAQVGIAGSSSVGNYCMLGGQVGMAGHIHVGDFAKIMAQSGLMEDVPPNATLCGTPAVPAREYFKQTAHLHRLDALARRVRDLERALAIKNGDAPPAAEEAGTPSA